MKASFLESGDSPVRDIVAGAVAGVAATVAIAIFMKLSAKTAGVDPAAPDAKGEPRIGSPEAATRGADAVSRAVTGDKIPAEHKQAATGVLQLAFGAALGAAYGLAARYVPLITAGRGSLFGGAVFAAFDEVLVPATGLSGDPRDSPAEAHGGALAVHVVYGAVLEAVRSLLRR